MEPRWVQTEIIPEPEQGALACVGGFVSQPHPEGQEGLPPLLLEATFSHYHETLQNCKAGLITCFMQSMSFIHTGTQKS